MALFQGHFTLIVRFIVIGCLSSVVHMCALWVLVELGNIRAMWANAIAFSIAFSISWSGHNFWTFKSKKNHNKKNAVRFLALQLLCHFVLNQTLYTLLLTYTPLHYLLVSFIVLVAIPFITFNLSKHWVFK